MCIQGVEPPNQKAAFFVNIIRVLAVLQLIIGILDIFVDNYFIKHGIFGIFLVFVLFMSQRILSHQILMIQIIISIFFSFQFLFAFLTFFQNNIDLVGSSDKLKFDFSIILLSLIYYLAVSIFVFYPYKQFKIIKLKENPALSQLFSEELNRQSAHEQRQVFYQPAYGDIKIDPKAKNDQKGAFQIQKGQGIVL